MHSVLAAGVITAAPPGSFRPYHHIPLGSRFQT
jgi:hypothetical protein